MTGLEALAAALEQAMTGSYPVDNRPRFENGKYRDCKWCQGRGCVSCKIECDKEYARQFPNGPEPVATFNRNNPEEMNELNKLLGCDIEAMIKESQTL